MLREAVALNKDQGGDWKKVSSHMEGTRSSKQCTMRWHDNFKLSDSGLVKEGAWTEDEVSVCWLCNKCNLYGTHYKHIVF